MVPTTIVERNQCFGYVSELTFIVTKQAIEHFTQKQHDAPPEHQDVYDYLFHRIKHVCNTMQTECTVQRDAFIRLQRHDGADVNAATEAWDALCREFTR